MQNTHAPEVETKKITDPEEFANLSKGLKVRKYQAPGSEAFGIITVKDGKVVDAYWQFVALF